MRNPQHDPLGSSETEAAPPCDKGSERRCVLTGQTGLRDEFLRLALSPDGDVLPDPNAKAPGRGAWIGVDKTALVAALANGKLRGALARAFKTGKLTIPDNLPDLAESGLKTAFLQRLGLEMRSGRIILGSDRIRDEARLGKIAALYHASDASEDGRRRLDQAFRVGLDAEGSGLRGEVLPLDRDALSVALGRENVVHLALADGKSAQRVAVPLGRLQTFLGAAPAAGTSEDAGALTGVGVVD